MTPATSYTRLVEVARLTGRTPERVRGDLRWGRIKADRPGTEYLFTPDQLAAALEFYGRPSRAPEGEAETNADRP